MGANIGIYTILAAGAVGAKTIVVEPIPATFGNLSRNVELNGLRSVVRCEQVGLSVRPGALRFTEHLDTMNHVISDGDGSLGVEIQVMTLDGLVGSDIPAVVKIDVEGYELPVLSGARRTLADERCLALALEKQWKRFALWCRRQQVVRRYGRA